MLLSNTRPRRHQEERRGTTFKSKAAAVCISQLLAAGWHHQQVYKEWDECREDRHPPSRPNAQLHPSTSLSPAASAQTWLPEDAEGQHLPEPYPFPIQHSDSKTLLLDCSRDTQQQLPSHLFSLCQMCSTPVAFAKLCADLPHSPPAHSAPSPMPHTLPALGGLSIPSLMFIFSRCCSDDSWTKTLHHPIILAHLPAPFQRQHQNLY